MLKIDSIIARFVSGCEDIEIESIVEADNCNELERKFSLFRSKLPDGYVEKASFFMDVYKSPFEDKETSDDYEALHHYFKTNFGFGFVEYFNSTLGYECGVVDPGGHIEIYWESATAKVQLDEAIEISELAFSTLAKSGIESDLDVSEDDDIEKRIRYIEDHIHLQALSQSTRLT